MFCPKCGLRNLEASKFCRGCGIDLSFVLAAAEAKGPASTELSEKYVEQFSRGLRGLFVGVGMLTVGVVGYMLSPRALPITLFALLFAAICLGTGLSRLIHAAGLRRLERGKTPDMLQAGETDLIEPKRSIYETDHLMMPPMSVTDRTTRHLKAER